MITNVKSKIIVSHQHFFADVIFSATSKVQNYQNPYTQTNTCSLHISRNFKDIFKYICLTLYLQKIVNNLERCIVFIDCHCLSCFFFQQLFDPISLEFICTYNDLVSISRHYYSVLYRNSMSEMLFYFFEHKSPCRLLN